MSLSSSFHSVGQFFCPSMYGLQKKKKGKGGLLVSTNKLEISRQRYVMENGLPVERTKTSTA